MADLVITLAKILVIILVVLLGVAYMTLAERKVSPSSSGARDPTASALGLLQPIADGLKFVLKEDFTPPGANRPAHPGADAGDDAGPAHLRGDPLRGTLPIFGHEVRLIVADLSIGILFMFAIASLASTDCRGGWSSNNKYALLGSLRASAQMISYEIAMGLAVIPVIMFVGSLKLTTSSPTRAPIPGSCSASR